MTQQPDTAPGSKPLIPALREQKDNQELFTSAVATKLRPCAAPQKVPYSASALCPRLRRFHLQRNKVIHGQHAPERFGGTDEKINAIVPLRIDDIETRLGDNCLEARQAQPLLGLLVRNAILPLPLRFFSCDLNDCVFGHGCKHTTPFPRGSMVGITNADFA